MRVFLAATITIRDYAFEQSRKRIWIVFLLLYSLGVHYMPPMFMGRKCFSSFFLLSSRENEAKNLELYRDIMLNILRLVLRLV